MAGPSEVALEVVTTSEVMSSWKSPATPPKITMNGNPFPAPSSGGPGTSSGWQLVVIDSSMDMTDPASVRLNYYFSLYPDSSGLWYDTYTGTYNNLGRFLLAAGNPETQLVFLASYGWDQNAPPTAFMLQQLLNIGAGPLAQEWTLATDRGSEAGWISFPTSYILVGGSAFEYGLGYEAYEYPASGPATAQVSVTLSNP